MPYGETKVYFDGSHYIAIPHTTLKQLQQSKQLNKSILGLMKLTLIFLLMKKALMKSMRFYVRLHHQKSYKDVVIQLQET